MWGKKKNTKTYQTPIFKYFHMSQKTYGLDHYWVSLWEGKEFNLLKYEISEARQLFKNPIGFTVPAGTG